MAENTKIEWTDHTFNPWIGCARVSPGCDHCYAAVSTPARAMGIQWGATETRHRTAPSTWEFPIRWNARHDAFFAKHGRRQRVFCASLADVFDNAVDPQWRADLFELIEKTPKLDWLLLTKRIGNVDRMVSEATDLIDYGEGWQSMWGQGVWPKNVWLGATIVNQEEAERDIPKLLAVPARARFLSMEPLLGPVDLSVIDVDGHSEIYPLKGTTNCEDDDGNPAPDLSALDWVIVGGESGRDARPMHPDWARNIRDQCEAAGTRFLFKQWGEWAPGSNWPDDVAIPSGEKCSFDDPTLDDNGSVWRVGKKAAGRELDGRTHDDFPEAP